MKKTEIFEDVVSIMTHDSSTVKDMPAMDAERVRVQIEDEMSEEDFLYQVQTYLAQFGVIGHLSFRRKDSKPKGFLLRSTAQGVFVERANPDTGLQVGDQILRIDQQPLEAMKAQHEDYFVSRTPERQYREWADLILRGEHVTVERRGQELDLQVQASQTSSDSRIEWRLLADDLLYLRLDDFMNEQAIGQLYEESRASLETARAVIIDVRHNSGGTDSLYLPLLHYALPDGKGYADLDWQDEEMEILYTERNVDLRLQSFAEWKQQDGVSQETLDLLAAMKQELLANRGKGYVPYENGDGEFFPDIRGSRHPEKIFVLADVYCGSSGDNFVQMMKQFPKVTVVGRPTLGILDYSNCCSVDYGDYMLTFPTSRSLAIDKGNGMTDKGVEPDVLVPWTVEHLKRDVDLETCLEMVGVSSV